MAFTYLLTKEDEVQVSRYKTEAAHYAKQAKESARSGNAEMVEACRQLAKAARVNAKTLTGQP